MKLQRAIHPGWIAGGIFAVVLLWLFSGMFSGESEDVAVKSAEPVHRLKVRARDSQAQDLTRVANVSGRTAPSRQVLLRAEVEGRLLELVAERGQLLAAGDVIARLEPSDRPAQLSRAKASMQERELQFRAAQKLRGKDLLSPVELAAAQSNLALAKADLEKAEQGVANSVIRAPFAGVLESREVELGDFVRVGDSFGRFIQRQPFLVLAQVTEDVVTFLHTGQSARALLPDGREVDGVLRYVATQANDATRTFPLELEVRGLDKPVIAGGSAVLMLPLELVRAHVLGPSALALSDEGEFGVMSVTAENRVEFHTATIAHAGNKEIWLTGLPDQLRIITVGQGFVSAGDEVNVLLEKASETDSDAQTDVEALQP